MNYLKNNLKVIEKEDIGNTMYVSVVDLTKSQITIPKDKLSEMTYQERMIMRRHKYGNTALSKTNKKKSSVISVNKQ